MALPGAAAADTAINGRIAFDSNVNGSLFDDYDIYTMEPDGSDMIQLTGTDPGEEASDAEPRWSPDGTQIAFQSNRDGDFEIYVMDADGSDVRQLTHDEVGSWNPSWSPSGDRIVYGGEDPNWENFDFDIFIVDVDGGSEPVNITEPYESELQWDDFSPDWSWVHNRIAFSGARYIDGPDLEQPGTYYKIVTVAADGSDEQLVSAINNDHDHDPRWSPDGNWIAFGTEPQPEQGWDVQVVHPDGTGQMNLTNSYFTQELMPSWSADGTRLLFLQDNFDDLYFIYTADFAPAPPTDTSARSTANPAELAPAEASSAAARKAPPKTRLTRVGGVSTSDWQRHEGLETCTIRGTNGANVLRGTAGADVICGLGGADTIYGLGGNDVLIGGAGNDKLFGGAGADLLAGEQGTDELRGGKGRDTLQGGAQSDRLYGGKGVDACSEGTFVGNEAGCDS